MSKYIDARDLLMYMRMMLTGNDLYRPNGIEAFVDSLPTADVQEVKHGRWIVEDKGIIVTSYCCSECGRDVRDDTGYDVVLDYPYCHCGAKMDEVSE